MSKYTLLLVLLLLQGRQDSTLVFVSRFLLVFFSALFSIGNCSFPVGLDPGDADYMSKLLKALNPTPPGWSENTSFCQWNGVNCTQPHSGRSPRVNAISLPSSSLSGELPQDLKSLSQLTHLDLCNNSLTGLIPPLAKLSSLETVYLADNNFASIPYRCFEGLTALQTLNLRNNPTLTEWDFPTELVQSRSLRTLELAHTKIVGELPAGIFDWFPSLQSVDLSSNNIGGSLPESLGRSRIRYLRLDRNGFIGPIPDLSNCTDLSDLQLGNNRLTGLVPPSLMALPSLQNVSLDNNYLQGPVPPVLFHKGVKATWKSNSFCQDDPGQPCDPRVTTLLEIAAAFGYPLDLAHSWQGNNPCEKENNWTCIDCEGGEIVTVNFGQRNYSGTVSPAFANLTSLRNLMLSGNNLTGSIPQSLTSLSQLELLDVSNNNLIGQVPNFSPKVKLNTKGNVNLVGFSRGAGDASPPVSGHRAILRLVLIADSTLKPQCNTQFISLVPFCISCPTPFVHVLEAAPIAWSEACAPPFLVRLLTQLMFKLEVHLRRDGKSSFQIYTRRCRIREVNYYKYPCTFTESWSIIVRVVRLWFVSDFNKQNIPFSMEMVLMDDKGDKIHASVRKTLIYKFDKELKEGCVYSISNFGVACNGGSFRTTRHDYKLNFQIGTKVLNIDNSFVSCSPFSLVPFSEINDSYDTNFLIDVMGFFTGVGTERQYERNGTPVKMNVIELEADGIKIECALFGRYVDDLNSFLATGEIQRPVVILQLSKVKPFQGKIQLQNAISCTKILFNPECAEVSAFKKRVRHTDDSPSQTLSQLAETPRISLEDEFLTLTQRKTILELKDCKDETCAVVLGTIKHILEEGEWWYTACTCNKAVYPDSKMFFCEKCNRHVLNVVPRYRIKVRVVDETDSATFVIFDRDASFLLNKSCSDMVDSFDKSAGASVIPREIMDLVDKTFIFKVEIKNGFSARFDQSFRVKRTCAAVGIIEKFKSLKKVDSNEEDGIEDIGSTMLMQDLMPKFVDAVVDSQSHCANIISLDCSQNVFPETMDATPVEKSLSKQVHLAADKLDENAVDKSLSVEIGLENQARDITPVKRTLDGEEQSTAGSTSVVPKKIIKIEKE